MSLLVLWPNSNLNNSQPDHLLNPFCFLVSCLGITVYLSQASNTLYLTSFLRLRNHAQSLILMGWRVQVCFTSSVCLFNKLSSWLPCLPPASPPLPCPRCAPSPPSGYPPPPVSPIILLPLPCCVWHCWLLMDHVWKHNPGYMASSIASWQFPSLL